MKNEAADAAARAKAEAKAEELQRVASEARANANNLQLYNDYLNRYINSMRQFLMQSADPYSKSVLDQQHENWKESYMSKVLYSIFLRIQIYYRHMHISIYPTQKIPSIIIVSEK